MTTSPEVGASLAAETVRARAAAMRICSSDRDRRKADSITSTSRIREGLRLRVDLRVEQVVVQEVSRYADEAHLYCARANSLRPM